jgi:hypothetical protein
MALAWCNLVSFSSFSRRRLHIQTQLDHSEILQEEVMYLISDYCHTVYMERYKELLREAERSRMLRSAASESAQSTDIAHRVGVAVERLIHLFRRRNLAVREVIQ